MSDINKYIEKIKYLETKPLSSDDMLRALGYKCNLITYSEIKNYKNINDILGKYNKCILLYETKKNYGHWTCIYKNHTKNTIFFFDSYGFIIDDQLDFIPKNNKKMLNSNYRYLTNLLYKSKCRIEYNQYQLQKMNPSIATCGRWVIARLAYIELSVDEFYYNFEDIKNKDFYITVLTDNI